MLISHYLSYAFIASMQIAVLPAKATIQVISAKRLSCYARASFVCVRVCVYIYIYIHMLFIYVYIIYIYTEMVLEKPPFIKSSKNKNRQVNHH